MEAQIILLIALVTDIALGEPSNLFHPVAWMGKVISFFEKIGTRRSPLFQLIYGTCITIFLIIFFSSLTYFVLAYLKDLNLVVYMVIGALLLKSTFSLKGLRKAALKVKNSLLRNKIEEARYELRSLVSRDTTDLSQPLLVSAAVESVAESTCDSFVAPLFYFLFFGIPGAVAYRVVNTIDSMLGYHGDFEYLGKFASRLDDVLNYIPARIAALLLVLASFFSGKQTRSSWQVAISEHSKTESPNAGWTIAAVAGALSVQLEKAGHYKLGKAGKQLIPDTIDSSLQLTLITASLWVIITLAARGIHFVLTT